MELLGAFASLSISEILIEALPTENKKITYLKQIGVKFTFLHLKSK